MNNYRNRLIFLSSLMVVFAGTLVYGYGPGYGNNLWGAIGIHTGKNKTESVSPKMSPSDMMTSEVTLKKMVTPTHVTSVTSVSPEMSPSISTEPSLIDAILARSPSSSTTAVPSHVLAPTVTTSALSSSRTLSPVITSTPAAVSPSPVPVTPPPVTPTPTPIPTSLQSAKININTAGLSELESLIGIGPSKGQAIIDYRTTNGPFQTIEDVMNVKGIKQATFDGMKDEITI